VIRDCCSATDDDYASTSLRVLVSEPLTTFDTIFRMTTLRVSYIVKDSIHRPLDHATYDLGCTRPHRTTMHVAIDRMTTPRVPAVAQGCATLGPHYAA